jgi:hypothetical protein
LIAKTTQHNTTQHNTNNYISCTVLNSVWKRKNEHGRYFTAFVTKESKPVLRTAFITSRTYRMFDVKSSFM